MNDQLENFDSLNKEINIEDIDNYYVWVLPAALDEKILEVIEFFTKLSSLNRAKFSELIARQAAWPLIYFAERMAALAVRRQSDILIIYGLSSLAIEGFRYDYSATIGAESILYHSAAKLSRDVRRLFYQVAEMAMPEVSYNLRYFSDHPKPIEEYGYVEISTNEGVFYLKPNRSLGDEFTISHLLPLLQDTDPAMRSIAAKSFGDIADNIMRVKRLSNIFELTNLRSKEPKFVWERLVDNNANESVFNDQELYELAQTIPLIKYWNHLFLPTGTTWLRAKERAEEGLLKIRNTNIVDSLIVALKDQEYQVRIQAIDSLGRIGDPRILPILTQLEHEYFGRSSRSRRLRAVILAAKTRIHDAIE